MPKYPALDAAQGKLDEARKALHGIMSEAKAHTTDGSYDMDAIKSLSGSKTEKLEEIRKRNEELASLKSEVDDQLAIKRAAEGVADYRESGDDRPVEAARTKSLGEHFTDSKAYKSKGESAHLDVSLKTLFERTAGWEPEVTRSGLVTLQPMVPAPSVVDHLVTMPVSQAGYRYMEETTYTNAAAERDEGTTYGEAALALTERYLPVEKIAVWLPLTDEQLEDEPGARAYVEARLTNMVRQKLDLQVLQGTGTNSGDVTQLLGTVNRSNIQTSNKGSDSIIDAAYKMFTEIRTDGFAEPSMGFIRPTDWQEVALQKTADGIYIYGNPVSGAPSVLWGVPVVQTMAAPADSFVTGDYANYAFLGVKRGLDVQVTNTHADHFINGKQAIRLDMRCVMVHVRPKAFGVVDLSA